MQTIEAKGSTAVERTTHVTPDAAGNAVRTQDAEGHWTHRHFDELGRLESVTENVTSNSASDPETRFQKTTWMGYDAADQLIVVQQPTVFDFQIALVAVPHFPFVLPQRL